jgi:phosphoribosylglycinamide formyltransferase-1
MRILTPVFLQSFGGRILNIHPALLPKHGGPGMFGHFVHEAVLKAGDQESGPTAHWVTEEVDAGAIILQERVPVLPGDNYESLAARVLEAEHRVYPEALRRVCLGQA